MDRSLSTKKKKKHPGKRQPRVYLVRISRSIVDLLKEHGHFVHTKTRSRYVILIEFEKKV